MSSIKGTLPDDDEKARTMIIQHLKSQGIFDAMRRECLADIDTKPAFINLTQRIEGYVSRFLTHQEWNPNLNKNQLREKLRRNLNESEMMKYGVEHLVDGAVHSKQKSFYPQIQKIVREFLGIEDEDEERKVKEEEKDMDMDTAEQDMDVDEDSNPAQEIHPKIETFVKSFREIADAGDEAVASVSTDALQPKIFMQLKKTKDEAASESSTKTVCETSQDNIQDHPESVDNSIPSDMDTDDSNEAKNPADLILEVKTSPVAQIEEEAPLIVKEEELLATTTMSEPEAPKETTLNADIVPDTTTVVQKEEEPPKITVKVEPESPAEEKVQEKPKAVKEVRKSSDSFKPKRTKERKSVDKHPVEQPQPKVPLEEILSDVSSVHTSDLSDFDDRISISSEDEETQAEDKKRKISLQEVKKLADKKKNKPRRSSIRSPDPQETMEVTTTSRRGRERKMNPKYASDDYSSIYSRGNRGSFVNTSMEEDIDSEEDFDLQETKEDARKGDESEEQDEEEEPVNVSRGIKEEIKLEETKETHIGSPTSSETSSSLPKAGKKRVQRRNENQTQRYDASDLYKPRPVIGSSRRNRSNQPPSDT